MLCVVSIKPPGLTPDKDKRNEGASGINVRRVGKRREENTGMRYIALMSLY
jgi:hypothetical protein